MSLKRAHSQLPRPAGAALRVIEPARLRAPAGSRITWVPVAAKLAVKLSLRWQRQQAGLTQAQVAKKAKVSQQQIAKLEDPDSNPTIEALEKVAKALGAQLEIALLPSPA
jgi:DNA-binding XRE family transcriptional regulator